VRGMRRPVRRRATPLSPVNYYSPIPPPPILKFSPNAAAAEN